MTESYFIASKGVLGLRTNAPGVKWSWGVDMPNAARDEYDQCAVKVRYSVIERAPEGAASDPAAYGKYHYFFGDFGADEVQYRRTFLGQQDLWMRVSGLVQDEIHVEVNSTYARFISHRFMNLHSPGYVLTDLVSWALLRSGYAPLHCSGFVADGRGVLVLAPPNTGKTLTTMVACGRFGANYLAEDVAITDGKRLYGVPWTSTFRYYDEIQSSKASRVRNSLTKVFPLAELVPTKSKTRIDALLGRDRILDSTTVDLIGVLERGEPERVVRPERAELVRKAVNLNRYEFNYLKAPTLVAYEYFNPEIDLYSTLLSERSIIDRLVKQAPQAVLAVSRDASQYARLLLQSRDD